eukprot:Skav228816  [mRNA]  locus=scaffold359:340431:343094:+ [translate_table: standard]
MVPVLSEGDPRPGLVELIQNLPLSRKILAFCNTVHEAQAFTSTLSEAGIAADHYNGKTGPVERQDILKSFQRPELHGGIRVLVTVDVLSEGVDLPVADTCLFVAPRQGVRLRQCVGRVLRKHHEKVDALVIAPPIVRRANGSLTEEAELTRLLSDLASTDPWFENLLQGGVTEQCRLSLSTSGISVDNLEDDLLEKAAQVLQIHVLPYVLDSCQAHSYWERAYQELLAYKGEHSHVLVPHNYSTRSGLKLGHWVARQRRAKLSCGISPEQVQRLTDVGFVWHVRRFLWKRNIQRLEAYFAKHGDLLVPCQYKSLDGFRLGVWVSTQRIARIKGKLAEEHIAELTTLGFVWDTARFAWDSAVERLKAHKAAYGHAQVPINFTCADGYRLGFWVSNQRMAKSKGKLDEERVRELDKLGFVWDVDQFAWDAAVRRLEAYRAEHGHTMVPRSYACADGSRLGVWVNNQRMAKTKGKLEKEHIIELDKLGFVWDVDQFAWDAALRRLEVYKAQHGRVMVPRSYTCADGYRLGIWVNNQRTAKNRGKLDEERVRELDKLGFVWDVDQFAWDAAVRRLEAYRAECGNAMVPQKYNCADGYRLGIWVRNQRLARAKGRLDEEHIIELDKLGFVWDGDQFAWDAAVRRLEAYGAEHGHVLVPQKYSCADGYRLGIWVNNQRSAKTRGKLDEERVRELDKLGFVWDVDQFAWDAAVRRLEAYRAEYGNAMVPQKYTCSDGYGLGVWVRNQRLARAKGRLDEEHIIELDKLGFVWDVDQFAWDAAVRRLKAYKAEHGHTMVPRSYTCADGYGLGVWVRNQRTAKIKDKLDRKQVAELNHLEFLWACRRPRENNMSAFYAAIEGAVPRACPSILHFPFDPCIISLLSSCFQARPLFLPF